MKKLILVLFITPTVVFGQKFKVEAPLPSIEKKSFYNVPLSPEITAWLESDFSNIRIMDETGHEVPYIIQVEQPAFSNVEFVEYKMEKTQQKNCCTTLTLINKEKKQMNNIILEVRNADVVKRATLRGSDDRQSWYALKEEFLLGSFSDSRRTSQLSILDFPLSNYEYYQVIINDSTTAPLNIVRSGYYNTNTDFGTYFEVPKVTLTSADSSKGRFTWAVVKFDTTQFIDKLEFDISGPAFYKREATLFDKRRYPVKSLSFISRHHASTSLSMKTGELLLQVENENNPPLKFNGVKAYQLKRSLTAWLEPGHMYKVALGDSLTTPTYDREFFRDSIPDHPVVLQLGAVKKFIKPVVATTSPTYFTNRNIIWVAIILVIAILGTMSVRMIRESKPK